MKIHVDIGRGLEKCPRLSTRGGEGVKSRQNIVHVVIEWPLKRPEYEKIVTSEHSHGLCEKL